jgi:hypothetical protein
MEQQEKKIIETNLENFPLFCSEKGKEKESLTKEMKSLHFCDMSSKCLFAY